MSQRRGLLMAVFLLVGAALPAVAADNVYIIRDVPVDETAASADEARRVAMAVGQAEAWRRLVLRLVVPGQEDLVPSPSAAELDSLVQGVEIADEKITSDRYRALVTVRFRGDAVRGLLDRSGVAHATTPSPLLLVLPVLEREGEPMLWDETSEWLRAWQVEPGGGKVVDVVVPFADLEDIMAIDAPAALAGDWTAMQAIMARYEADGVLVATARPGATGLDLAVTWHEGPQPSVVPVQPPTVLALGGTGTEFAPETLAAAIAAVRSSVDAQWSAATMVPEGPEATLVADIVITSLAEWVDIRGRLQRPASIVAVQPLVVSAGKVRVELRYVGGLEQLGQGLAQAGLTLTAQGDVWIILPL